MSLRNKTIAEALREGKKRLQRAGKEAYAVEAELLLEKAVGLNRTALFLRGEEPLSAEAAMQYEGFLAERESGRPTQYILGTWEFMGLPFSVGEGVLIPGEILHHAAHGCRAFVILQPFGCLPNHVVGRGIVKKMREMYPDAQILPLDYDPDVSFANLENRLQMLIMNVKERSVDTVALPDVGQRSPVETMNRKQKNADNKKQKVS